MTDETYEREVMVLPINGQRENAIQVFAYESEQRGIQGYVVKSDIRGVRYHTDEWAAFSDALARAAWNAVVVPLYTDD